MNINALLSQARSLRVEAHSLMREAGAASHAQTNDATKGQQTLDELVRSGSDPAQLEAFLAQREARYEGAKKNEVALEDMSKRFGDMFAQLSSAVDAKDTSGEQSLLHGEVGLCIRTMAELGDAVRAAVFETSIAAALAGKTESGLIIGAKAAKPSIILPPGFKRVS